MGDEAKAVPEIPPSAIQAICNGFKLAANIYCREYPHSEPFTITDKFDTATKAYDRRKRRFNKAVQEWLKSHGELPGWAKETIAYQTERGFLDPLWKTWEAE